MLLSSVLRGPGTPAFQLLQQQNVITFQSSVEAKTLIVFGREAETVENGGFFVQTEESAHLDSTRHHFNINYQHSEPVMMFPSLCHYLTFAWLKACLVFKGTESSFQSLLWLCISKGIRSTALISFWRIKSLDTSHHPLLAFFPTWSAS